MPWTFYLEHINETVKKPYLPSEKRSTLKEKKLLPMVANSFLLE